ncbi:metallophosphoesterase [Bacillus massilinigeriensis]|uniref:metallophosphoesterase n=1 Tax=Bacillus massilionigeriensis TaxID=1805475 RepID=UPI00096B3B2C|nr:metallophosphoesterase [Bacillus massilionigeriensis]
MVSVFVYMYKEAYENRVVYHTLEFSDFPGSFGQIHLFFISDIHKRIIDDSIINEVKGKADIVIIGGDLLEKNVSLDHVGTNLTKLKKVAPIYFVWGNNDYEIDYHLLDATLLEHGVKILDNTSATFESELGERFALLGIDDISQERDRLDLALLDTGEIKFKVLVSHNPKIIEKINSDQQIQLILSGHTHGGQIHILGYSPFKKGGIEKINDTVLLISNGYGTTMLPLRLGAKAETHLITLTKNLKEI